MGKQQSSGGRAEAKGSTSAKILYRPVGIVGSLVGGLVAGQVFKQVYKRVAPGHPDDPPTPLQSEYPLREIVLASLLQGAIFAAVKALVDRGGARAFERWTGEWPGD
ncbi:DUF4235 domain-containing protein [Isoptericola sp. NEAU-Y5]|uniref:DUF4235 domain-containing protein n=1 Tax=Isoptericola luteus TaxID=2879484 RepID=A0ABS7ZGN5_9MICO|nr:DUF4235 domain-containing protein [Isoptericola sp. NEAU-Y5]MCA5894176.1 DUF4235 domain-containing protein [Isoptericola sp. NEAU-Y5]